jgi:cation diffusion facilitator family transporter
LADTLHNLGDAATAVPLWLAFHWARRPPTARFSYGLGRAEDLAGLLVVAAIVAGAALVGRTAWLRLLSPEPVAHLGAVAAAGLLGCLGNEAVARFRIREGEAIGSMALVADGHHARADALTSLGVVAGAAGVAAGWPLADPLAGLAIAGAILVLAARAAGGVLARLLDGVEPALVPGLERAARRTPGVRDVVETRARWVGHRLAVEVAVAVDPGLSVGEAHAVAEAVRERLARPTPPGTRIAVRVVPADAAAGPEAPADAGAGPAPGAGAPAG